MEEPDLRQMKDIKKRLLDEYLNIDNIIYNIATFELVKLSQEMDYPIFIIGNEWCTRSGIVNYYKLTDLTPEMLFSQIMIWTGGGRPVGLFEMRERYGKLTKVPYDEAAEQKKECSETKFYVADTLWFDFIKYSSAENYMRRIEKIKKIAAEEKAALAAAAAKQTDELKDGPL